MRQFNSTREQVAFLARRATWGLAPGELDVLKSLGVAATIDRLVDASSAGFAEEASGDLDRVMVITTSEFGRQIAENGSAGTDHGKGGLQFIFGPTVAGGIVHGGYDLGAVDDGGVPPSVDTRSVYRSALEWLGGPDGADGVFEEDPAVLGLLTA